MNRRCGDELPKGFFRKEGKMEKFLLALWGDEWVFETARRCGAVANVVTLVMVVLVLKIVTMLVVPMMAGVLFLALVVLGILDPRVFLIVLVWVLFFLWRRFIWRRIIHAFRA